MSQIWCSKGRGLLSTRPDDERQDERFSTYSDGLVLGPSGKKFTVWAKADTPNVKVVRVIRRFIDQNAVQELQSASGVPPCNMR